MSVKNDRPTIKVRLLSSTFANGKISSSPSLILYPGEFGTLAVEFTYVPSSSNNASASNESINSSRNPELEFQMEFPYDFPLGCFRGWHEKNNPYQIDSNRKSYLTFSEKASEEIQQRWLHFGLPLNFFEEPNVINDRNPKLQLDYEAKLYVYTKLSKNSPKQLVDLKIFTIQIRPQSDYLRLLPSVYQHIDFVGRFLKIMEETFDPTLRIEINELLWAYLNPMTAPRSLLPFLAHWVGWKLDPRMYEIKDRSLEIRNWTLIYRQVLRLFQWQKNRIGLQLCLHLYSKLPLVRSLDEIDEMKDEIQDRKLEIRNRKFIANAVQLYRWRGTRIGLKLYIHLYTDLPLDRIEIQDFVQRGLRLASSRLGQGARLGGGKAFHFQVRLRVGEEEIDEMGVREAIDSYKPVFTTYSLKIDRL